jgi:hypothetical protein
MLVKFLDCSEREFSNLCGANLSGANLGGADLSDSDLSDADLSGADLRWADLSWANLSGVNLRWANLSGVNLRWANLSGADLRDADLHSANLQNAKTTLLILSVDGIGSKRRKTTYCKDFDKVWCGAFCGTLEEFESTVNKTYKDNSKYLGQYLAAIAFFRSAS